MFIGNVSTDQMQKTQIVTYLLVQADQEAPETIQPTVRALDHPPPRLETRLLFEGLGLFPSRPDVGGEATLGQQLAYFIVVVALVQAHPLRCGRARLRPLNRDTLDGRARHLEVMTIGPLDRQAEGHATAVGEHAALGADLAAVGRVLAHRFPPREALVMAPSIALRSSTRGRWHPRGCGLRGGSSGSMRSHNASGIRQSRWDFSWSFFIRRAPVGGNFSYRIPLNQPTGLGSYL